MSEQVKSETAPKGDEVVVVDETPAAPEAPAVPTREELRAKGWSAKELDNADKRGMLKKPESAPKLENDKDAPKPEAGKETPKPEVKPKGSLPDFTMTPEQEKVFLETFGAGTAPRAMYFRMKNERQSRQASESRVRELEAQLAARTAPKPEPEVDDNGQPIDIENQPLTLKALKDLQKAEAEAYQRQQEEQTMRGHTLREAQTAQEEYARSIYPDFDKAVELAKDVMTNLDALVPEKWKQTKVVKLVRELQVAAAEADKYGLEDYHAAMIAYELGQLHPKYGQAPAEGEQTGTQVPKPTGGKTPEQMKRIEDNTRRRASSATVADGSGKRTISASEMDLATLNKMSLPERLKFREKYPDQYTKLLRGS